MSKSGTGFSSSFLPRSSQEGRYRALSRERGHRKRFSHRFVAAAEVLIGEADGDRTLADRRSYSFDRAAADVTDGEHARQTGFEQVGIAAQLFPGGRVAGWPAEIRAGDNEAVAVQLDRISQPLGARLGADQDEQGRGGQRAAKRPEDLPG